MKILIAEDNAVSRKLLAATLRQLGHTVVTAEDGRQAWQICRTESVSVLISDWMMPAMDGLALCRQLRQESSSPYTYFVLLTALDGKQNYLKAMAAGADDFITKPFDREQLAARLHVAERMLRLQAEVKELRDLLCLCSWCNKIRDEHQQWVPLEAYVAQQMGTDISHSICPQCLAEKRQSRAQE